MHTDRPWLALRDQNARRFFKGLLNLEALAAGEALPEDDALPGQEDYCPGFLLNDLSAKVVRHSLFCKRMVSTYSRCLELHLAGKQWVVQDLGEESRN